MAKKLGPGMAQLGRAPMTKDKLEGPKVHHDDHGPNDSVPAKGSKRAIPGEHWEQQFSRKSMYTNAPGNEMNPKLAKIRPCTHVKVNETDH
jgi:hypothetical protein